MPVQRGKRVLLQRVVHLAKTKTRPPGGANGTPSTQGKGLPVQRGERVSNPAGLTTFHPMGEGGPSSLADPAKTEAIRRG